MDLVHFVCFLFSGSIGRSYNIIMIDGSIKCINKNIVSLCVIEGCNKFIKFNNYKKYINIKKN